MHEALKFNVEMLMDSIARTIYKCSAELKMFNFSAIEFLQFWALGSVVTSLSTHQ